MRHCRSFIPEVFRGLVAWLAVIGLALPAADQVISGNPLSITAMDGLEMKVFRLQSTTDPQTGATTVQAVRQYFDTYGAYLWLTSDGVSTCYASGSFVPVSNAKPDPWTTVTTVTAADAVRITQRVTYQNGTQIYRHEWTIANGGSTTYTDSSFLYGGDTYFAGSDSANGYYNAGLGMVSCTNSAYDGLMGLFGGVESPATHFQEGYYGTVVANLANAGVHLPDTYDEAFVDNGMGLEWVHGAFAPGDTITIVAYEKWTNAGFVQVLAPQPESTSLRAHIDMVFTVQNLRDADDTVTFAVTASSGLAVSVPSPVTIAANSSMTVTVGVDVGFAAAGRTGSVVLAGTSGTDSVVTRDTAQVTVASAPVFPVAVPSIPVSGRGQTVYGAISPATPQGASRLLAALTGRSANQAVCYAWDAPRQTYVRLPAEPTGGILASTGAFLATRVGLGLEFSGTPENAPWDLVLQPGWNLVGVPLLDDDGVQLASHDFFADFQLLDHDGVPVTDAAAFTDTLGSVGSGDPLTARPHLFDGQGYAQVSVLTTGRGYWCKNNGDLTVTLRRMAQGRQPSSLAAGVRPATRTAVVYRDRGAPPAAPAAPAEEHADGGGCGAGSGIAALLAFGWLVLRRRAA